MKIAFYDNEKMRARTTLSDHIENQIEKLIILTLKYMMVDTHGLVQALQYKVAGVTSMPPGNIYTMIV